jgi:hypothetical protein
MNQRRTWQKSAGADDGQDVYIQKLDVDGVPRWENSGIKLNTTNFASHPDVTISDSIGGAQATWHQVDAQGNDRIWYAKLSAKGIFTFHEPVDITQTGTSPFIVYTPRTALDTSGAIPRPAYIAHLKSGGSVTELGLWAGRNTGFGTITIPPQSLNLGDLRLASSVSGEAYVVAWETTYPNARLMTAWTYPHVQGQTTSIWVSSSIQDVRGADVAADFAGGGMYKDGMAVFCADLGAGLNLYGLRMAASTQSVSGPFTLTNAGSYERPSQPSMVSDSSFNTNGYGGMLVAWDWEYDMNSTPKHKVQTNKLEFAGGVLRWSNNQIIDASAPTNALTYPSIARISNQTPALDTMSFIVWEGMTELCSPARSKEVLGNWVVYNNYGPILRRAQWQYEKQIGPGGGTYTQTRPLVRTSRDNSVNAYWIDGRGPHDLVLGTRAWPKDTVFIIWGKDVADEMPVAPGLPRIGAHYPQPLSLSAQRISHVEVETDRESSARLALYDNLGREVGIVFDGTLPAGRTLLPFDVSGLAPGMYHYVLQGIEHVATRGLVIIR